MRIDGTRAPYRAKRLDIFWLVSGCRQAECSHGPLRSSDRPWSGVTAETWGSVPPVVIMSAAGKRVLWFTCPGLFRDLFETGHSVRSKVLGSPVRSNPHLSGADLAPCWSSMTNTSAFATVLCLLIPPCMRQHMTCLAIWQFLATLSKLDLDIQAWLPMIISVAVAYGAADRPGESKLC